MSTRSVVAYPHGDGWQGVYCHSDGYPSWQGLRVIEQVQMFGGAGIRRLIEATPQGFSCFPETPYPFDAADIPYESADEETNEALFIEWVYVVNERGTITVLASVEAPGEYTREGYNGQPFTQPRYRWEIVGQVDCRDQDADEQMRAIEDQRRSTRGAA